MTDLLFVVLSANHTINLTMKGGDQFSVTDPIVVVSLQVRFAIYRHTFFFWFYNGPASWNILKCVLMILRMEGLYIAWPLSKARI